MTEFPTKAEDGLTEEEYQRMIKRANLQFDACTGVVDCAGCGKTMLISEVYHCLYCDLPICHSCAEDHFGQTIKEYHSA